MTTVLLMSGLPIRAPLCTDPHTGAPYIYHKNANGIYTRVYVAEGESVPYYELPGADGHSVLEHTRAPRKERRVVALAA